MAAEAGTVDLGVDQTALVQEYLPAERNSIVRVEVLGGVFLYTIRIALPEDDFNLCPAGYCRMPAQRSDHAGLVNGVSGRGLPIEGSPHRPRLSRICSVSWRRGVLRSARWSTWPTPATAKASYYDVNALSNFVANALKVVGFDPFPKLVDYLLVRAGLAEPVGTGR